MTRRVVTAAIAGCALTVLTACGVQPSGVEEGPSAPTGLASGMTLYFLDDAGELTAERRDIGRLGTTSDAVSLLLTGPGSSDSDTGIASTSVTLTEVTVRGELMSVRVPISSKEATSAGVDQIVCTAVASHIQAGGSEETRVRIQFTDHVEGPRGCPVLG